MLLAIENSTDQRDRIRSAKELLRSQTPSGAALPTEDARVRSSVLAEVRAGYIADGGSHQNVGRKVLFGWIAGQGHS